MRNGILIAVLSAGLLTAVQAEPRRSAETRQATVGEFAVQVSTALGYRDPLPEAAARNLRAHGVDLAADFGAPLTEGMAARVMADLGHRVVKPTEPSTRVSEARARFLAGLISVEGLPGDVGLEGDDDGDDDDEDEIPPVLQCLHSENSAVCIECCVSALPSWVPSGLGLRFCTKICAFNVPPPSLSEPGS